MILFDIFLLVGAGFAAGLLNAVAGGGTFLSLPALIYVGVASIWALVRSGLLRRTPGSGSRVTVMN